MKRMSVVLTIALMAATLLSGCIIVPFEGGHRGGFHHREWHHQGW